MGYEMYDWYFPLKLPVTEGGLTAETGLILKILL